MLISLEWLNEYISLEDMSAEDIARALTQLGLEVEGWKKLPELDERMLIGYVLSAEKHKNADTLRVCKVDVGGEKPLDIVCGAHNARAGIKVAVATVGAVMPDGLKIKNSKIRGEESFGMMCSERELNLSENHDGIIELSETHTVGQKVSDVFPLGDTVFDISITPNRGDALSYIGIARELSAKTKKKLRLPFASFSFKESGLSDSACSIVVEPDVGCMRFTASTIEGVKAISSPLWLKRRLSVSGIRPINLIVDVSNYVMLELGQPIHMYDKRFLEGFKLHVREAKKGETLVTLDQKERHLEAGDILICDGKKAIGLAGVMGGLNTEIKEDTESIVIEAAHFFESQIRKTSKRCGIHTEASQRFERGIDIERIEFVMQRAASLVRDLSQEAGVDTVRIHETLAEFYPTKVVLKKIAIRVRRAKKLLGLAYLSGDQIKFHLESLGLVCLDKTDERLLMEIPSWRNDLVREVDLIEEVARMEGYDKVPYELPRTSCDLVKEDPLVVFIDECKNRIAGLGLTEVKSFPFASKKEYRDLGIDDSHALFPNLELLNPLSEGEGSLQTTLIPSLLSMVIHNHHHSQKGAHLFEVGRGYFPYDSKALDFLPQHALRSLRHTGKQADKAYPIEVEILSGVLDAPFVQKDWQHEEKNPGFFEVKELFSSVLRGFGITSARYEVAREFAPFLHPSSSALVKVGDLVVGYLGELHPEIAQRLDLLGHSPVFFELYLENLLTAIKVSKKTSFSCEKYFQAVTRDLAFTVERSLPFSAVEAAVETFPRRKNLRTYEVFDVYKGSGIPADKKSFALSFVFQSSSKTLTDQEVDKEIGSLMQWLQEKVEAVQR